MLLLLFELREIGVGWLEGYSSSCKAGCRCETRWEDETCCFAVDVLLLERLGGNGHNIFVRDKSRGGETVWDTNASIPSSLPSCHRRPCDAELFVPGTNMLLP